MCACFLTEERALENQNRVDNLQCEFAEEGMTYE